MVTTEMDILHSKDHQIERQYRLLGSNYEKKKNKESFYLLVISKQMFYSFTYLFREKFLFKFHMIWNIHELILIEHLMEVLLFW